ncbi:centrosomal protein 20-like [Uloborus diversus]|uniref:centrosomal protein 20-like n=1 Tax=Uloborus diversus TaxID=327109 RepID=UPI002409A088|nr:centrosomal protein 20-like [Uloborus diversus]
MATARDLKDALKEALSKSGVLAEIRARIRAEVFNVLQDDADLPPPLSNDNLIINELIREYLIYNGYFHTESVLTTESGQPQIQMARGILEEHLNVKQLKENAHIPLLYGLVSYFAEEIRPSTSKEPSA